MLSYLTICTNWAYGVYESFRHVISCTWLTTLGVYLPDGTAWNWIHSFSEQSRSFLCVCVCVPSSLPTHSDTPCWCSHYNLLSVHALTWFQAHCFKSLFPNSRKGGRNTSLSPQPYLYNKIALSKRQMPFDTHRWTNIIKCYFKFCDYRCDADM